MRLKTGQFIAFRSPPRTFRYVAQAWMGSARTEAQNSRVDQGKRLANPWSRQRITKNHPKGSCGLRAGKQMVNVSGNCRFTMICKGVGERPDEPGDIGTTRLNYRS